MKGLRSVGHPVRGVARRPMAAFAVVVCTLGVASALSVPAGALGFGPHDAGAVPHSSVQAHDIAPLTLANIVVTDLSTNVSTVDSWANPAPVYSNGENCNTSPHDILCINYGSGPGTADGGAFQVLPPGSAAAGQDYVSPTMSVTADNIRCGTGTGGDPGASSAVEVDQYLFTPGPSPVKTVGVQFDCTNASVDITGTIAFNIFPTTPGSGYYLFGQQGEITGFGNDNYLSYLNGAQYYNLNSPIVGLAPTPDGAGYWMVGGDGGVFSSGDAQFYGSTGNLRLNKPVVGMAATPDGKGYWFVATDGGIFSYGDAQFYGSTGNIRLNKPIVGMTATPDGGGYWLVASDGGIFAFGDAQFYGSTGNIALNKPIVGMTTTPDGHGYWLVASDGGIFAYGDARFYGSTGNIHLNQPIVGMAAAPDGQGYWFVALDGGVFNYGSAQFAGSLGGSGVNDAAGISTGI